MFFVISVFAPIMLDLSIFHVFLVWMGKSIPRAYCSIGGDEACRSSSQHMLHYALGMDFPIHTRNPLYEHMKDTYIAIATTFFFEIRFCHFHKNIWRN